MNLHRPRALSLLAAGCLALASIPQAFAQQGVSGDVRLFQSFFRDARISSSHYAGGRIFYGDFDNADVWDFDAFGGYVVNRDFELEGMLGLRRVSNGGSETGLQDALFNARYLFRMDLFDVAVGGTFTLPIGKEEVGADRFDFGGYGAIRIPLDQRMTLTGTLGLNFLDLHSRETSVNVGAGLLFGLTQQTHLVGELAVESEIDYVALSGGVDHLLANGGRLRGALIVGLDDGAPDIGLNFEFLLPLRL